MTGTYYHSVFTATLYQSLHPHSEFSESCFLLLAEVKKNLNFFYKLQHVPAMNLSEKKPIYLVIWKKHLERYFLHLDFSLFPSTPSPHLYNFVESVLSFLWVPGSKLMLSGWLSKCFYLPSHLTSPPLKKKKKKNKKT